MNEAHRMRAVHAFRFRSRHSVFVHSYRVFVWRFRSDVVAGASVAHVLYIHPVFSMTGRADRGCRWMSLSGGQCRLVAVNGG